jgi:hypothetical protein
MQRIVLPGQGFENESEEIGWLQSGDPCLNIHFLE